MVEQLTLNQWVVGSTPTGRTTLLMQKYGAMTYANLVYCIVYISHAAMAKLADALDLGSSGVTHGGSSPSSRTISYELALAMKIQGKSSMAGASLI